ncbi:hypothetical protein GCM10028771_05340 [Nocardioides marmoraquaticus]
MQGVRRGREAALRVARAVRRRQRAWGHPLLSVVVPVHDAAETLERCVESLMQQRWSPLEVLLVVHRDDAAAASVAAEVARGRRLVSVLPHEGPPTVGAARNAGVAAARGAYLTFCDADDDVTPEGYRRLVEALERSGSDVAVGGVAVQYRGRYERPGWLGAVLPVPASGLVVREEPQLLAHPYLGARVFRRTSWGSAGLRFAEQTAFPHHVLLAQVGCTGWRAEVHPGTAYRVHQRPDRGSLTQRSQRDPALAHDRLDRLVEASRVLRDDPGAVQAHLRGSLVTVVADLIRFSLVLGPQTWEGLSPAVGALMADADADTWADVPVTERVLTSLCVRQDFASATRFERYAHASRAGMQYELVDGVPRVVSDELEGLGSDAELITRLSPHELQPHTRLRALRWLDDRTLRLEGNAFVDYLTAADPAASTVVLLEEEGTGRRWPLPTEPVADDTADVWAARSYEDLGDCGFAVDVDVTTLPLPEGADRPVGEQVFRVLVEHTAAGTTRTEVLQTRVIDGSAGLLLGGGVPGHAVRPTWVPHEGLRLLRRAGAPERRRPDTDPDALVTLAGLELTAEAVVLTLVGSEPVELALRSARLQTAWVAAAPHDGGLRAVLPLRQDEWGVGSRELPHDRYELVARRTDVGQRRRDEGEPASATLSFWASLPWRATVGTSTVIPEVDGRRRASLRVLPAEWRDDVYPLRRRELREVLYPRWREEPLLEVALFETFAGKAGGDSPAPVAAELHRRRPDLDLVFVVEDRSVVVPDVARKVVRLSAEHLELWARARYVVVNAGQPSFLRRREGQVVVQTWHGSPLKRIGHDRLANDVDNWFHRQNLVDTVRQWDHLVAQSPFARERLREAFRFDGSMLDSGYPRNDVLCSPGRDEVARATRARLGIPADAKVVLYAPTWRETRRSGFVYDKVLYLDAEQAARDLGCHVLVRGHYNSMRASEDRDPTGRVVDVTRYPDIADLYLACDAMVTDYSSAFFDFAVTDKPMVFLAPDLAAYRDDSRGFYLDYADTVPGPIRMTSDEVVAELREELRDPGRHAERRERFRGQYAPWDDGGASARVVDALLGGSPAVDGRV